MIKKINYLFLSISALISSQVDCKNIDIKPFNQDLLDYIDTFPESFYKKYDVPGLGSFFLDDANDAVKSTLKKGELWETYIIDTLKKYLKPGQTAIDIGAHCGSISIAMSKLVGPKGRVFSFEAERQFLRELYMNLNLNEISNVTLMNYWVSNEDVEFLLGGYPTAYSPVGGDYPEPVYVFKTKLDSLDLPKIDFMKIDVECTEDLVLEGAHNLIMRDRPIMIIEIMGGFDGYELGTPEVRARIEKTISNIEALNYKVSKIWTDDYLAVPVEYEISND